jgi:hypothetical protein
MQLESGIRISVLPHFRPTLLTRAELCLNSGFERRQSRFKARHDWRPPTEQERRILTAPEGDVPENQVDRIELLEIPGHLPKEWRPIAQKLATDTDSPSQENERFVAALASFFRFKKVHVENCSFTIVAAEPTHRSAFTRLGSPGGLKVGTVEESPLLAVNLGDEPTALVILNLPIRRIRELVASRGVPERPPIRITQQFLELFPEYPLVRLVLPTRQGVHFFPDAVVHDGCTAKKNDLDILLRITRAPRSIS